MSHDLGFSSWHLSYAFQKNKFDFFSFSFTFVNLLVNIYESTLFLKCISSAKVYALFRSIQRRSQYFWSKAQWVRTRIHNTEYTIKRISMSISGSCLPKPGKCPGKPLIALPDQSNVSMYRFLRWYPIGIDEGRTAVIISGMDFCDCKSCPFDTPRNPIWWMISKPYLHSEIANWCTNIWRARLPKFTYSNSCVWPAGLQL